LKINYIKRVIIFQGEIEKDIQKGGYGAISIEKGRFCKTAPKVSFEEWGFYPTKSYFLVLVLAVLAFPLPGAFGLQAIKDSFS